MNITDIEKHIAKMQEDVGKQRDKLDEYICELGELAESCERAWDALQDARDALSELV